MAKREDVDLWLVLTDPVEARRYIEEFDWRVSPPPSSYITESGKRIFFESMSDEEAVIVAMDIVREYEMPQVLSELALQQYLH